MDGQQVLLAVLSASVAINSWFLRQLVGDVRSYGKSIDRHGNRLTSLESLPKEVDSLRATRHEHATWIVRLEERAETNSERIKALEAAIWPPN